MINLHIISTSRRFRHPKRTYKKHSKDKKFKSKFAISGSIYLKIMDIL